jgi:hypothetical protein
MISKANGNLYSRYTFYDECFKDFMFDFLRVIEPRCENKNEILYVEQEEFNEIFFISKGIYKVGFSINN